MGTTLTDIARETGTSVSTVSRVLAAGAAAARISADTRRKVLDAARRLGYRPNLVARSLRTRRSHTVALLVSDIANPWFGRLASLIERALHRHGYSLVLCNSGEDLARERDYLALLPAKGIDGLIVVPLARTRKALFESLPENTPLVVLDRPIPGIAASVWTDHEQMAGLLCDVLRCAGARRVALVRGPSHIVTHRRRAEIVSARFEVVASHEGPAQKETGRCAWVKFVEAGPFDAVVCTNNFLGQGVIDAMGEAGESPPIVGCFDEIPMMHLLPMPIVCSVQDVEHLAEACVEQLLRQLEPDPAGGEAQAPSPTVLQARAIANAEFQKRMGGG